MGERAKVILNEYSAKNLLMRDTLDLDKFYTADLKLFVEVARKEIERLNNIIKRLEEFIEYLEKRYKDITGVIGSYGSNTDMLYGKKDMIKEILKKCKEIEQGSDEE